MKTYLLPVQMVFCMCGLYINTRAEHVSILLYFFITVLVDLIKKKLITIRV